MGHFQNSLVINNMIIETTRKYEEENPPDFITHLNYISFLSDKSKNLEIKCSLTIGKQIERFPAISKKINLINLTWRGIEWEYKNIIDNPEYAVICVSWISVKSYYLLFNLCLIMKYLLTGDKAAFNSSHSEILNNVKGYIARGELVFNRDEFNRLYSCQEALKWKARSGSNIKIIGVDENERFMQIIKKLANYSLEEYKRANKIKNFKSKKNKELYIKYIGSKKISICEFLYWYRIKANYRDLEYLNKDINAEKFKQFYSAYYELTKNIFNAFSILINSLAKDRLGEVVI